jgi:hypothetical protein
MSQALILHSSTCGSSLNHLACKRSRDRHTGVQPFRFKSLQFARWQHAHRSRGCIVPQAENTDAEATLTTATLRSVTIKKPLGLVLEEAPDGGVVVAEIVPGGNADMSGADVQVGDIVARTSAVVLKKDKEGEFEREGYGQRPYTNWQTIEFDCAGQSYDTVLAAIGSNNERWGIRTVTLTLRRS